MLTRRQAEKMIRQAQQAAEEGRRIEETRWRKLTTLAPDEVRIQHIPVVIGWFRGQQLSQPAGGFVFVTDRAVHFAMETDALAHDPGRDAPYIDCHRILYADACRVQTLGPNVALWEADEKLTTAQPLVTMANMGSMLEVLKTVGSRTAHLPADCRRVPRDQ